MKRISALILAIVMLGITGFAANDTVSMFSGTKSVSAEIGFESADGERESANAVTKQLLQSSMTAEMTLQSLKNGTVLRAEVVLHLRLPGQEAQNVECWYELENQTEVPHITVIEKNQNADSYYVLDVNKLPGGTEKIKAVSRALRTTWENREKNGEVIAFSSEDTAELLLQWYQLWHTETEQTAVAFDGIAVQAACNETEKEKRISLRVSMSARQAALLFGMREAADESRVVLTVEMRMTEAADGAEVKRPQAETMQDVNLMLDYKMFDPNRISVLYNGNLLRFDAQPRLENETTMVPIRGIMEAAGVPSEQISFDGETGKVTIRDGEKMIVLYLGQKTAWVNDKAVMLSCTAYETEGRTFVPLRFVSEELGFRVDWTGLDGKDGMCRGGVVRLER